MNIKKSYVYRSIRRAAAQNLLSLRMLRFCIYLTFLVLSLHSLFFEFDWDRGLDILFPMFFFVIFLIVCVALGTVDLIRNVIELISPKKSIAAKRYANIILFEEMCARVESQYLQPLTHLEYWGITMLKDFIIYERYGQFFVIPYSAVQLIQPWWPKRRSYSRECPVAIQDILSNWYVIVCGDRDEKEKVIHILNDVLQRVREKGSYL